MDTAEYARIRQDMPGYVRYDRICKDMLGYARIRKDMLGFDLRRFTHKLETSLLLIILKLPSWGLINISFRMFSF